jgi:DNA-binding NarL/FixJ family response regulator
MRMGVGISHFFVTPTGTLLPGWREAFPKACSCMPNQRLSPTGITAASSIGWLRLTPGMPVTEQMARARSLLGGIPLVVLSDQPDDDEALAALSAAARGYCNSHASPTVLRQIAAVVLAGGLWIGESLMGRLLTATARLPVVVEKGNPEWQDKLTDREREVAQAVAAGASNKEIARQLGITERTVKGHVGAILEKLSLRDRLQLALTISGRRPA